MRVSIIIPALNEAAVIERAITAAWQADADEVIVVDGGSHDDTVARAEAANCRVIASSPGRACQQNRGAAQATGDVLLVQHADKLNVWLVIDLVVFGLLRHAACAKAMIFWY